MAVSTAQAVDTWVHVADGALELMTWIFQHPKRLKH